MEEVTYLIQVTRSDVETFPMRVQMAFYRNLAREIARKMRGTNHEYVRAVSDLALSSGGRAEGCVHSVKERVGKMV